jgi:hypothetical protein
MIAAIVLGATRSFGGATALLLLVSAAAGAPSPPAAPAPAATAAAAFSAGSAIPVWTLKDRQTSGLFFYPDMPIGVVKGPRGQYQIFGPGTGKGGGSAPPNGTYECKGTLDHFAPARKGPKGPLPSMRLGRLQPSPDGSDFDRDYGGGGPVFFLDAGGARPLLINVYHGEYHADEPKVPPSYGATGLAFSQDEGSSFVKLGEILSPHATRQESQARKQNVFADGNLIEADANGDLVVGSGGGRGGRETYFYSVFSDRQSLTERQGFGIARVRKSEAVAAIARRRAPRFKKYFVPSGATIRDGERGACFTEPGIGGRSTYVVTENEYIATPQVRYDSHLRQFILVYQQNQNSVWVRTATNLFHWSKPTALVAPVATTKKVFYPSAVGEGPDPTVLGQRFFLYYVSGTVTAKQPNVWITDGALWRKEITILNGSSP